jgi:hypothetical protein
LNGTNKLVEVSYMKTVRCLALLKLQHLQTGCRSTMLNLKVGAFGIFLNLQVVTTHRQWSPFSDAIF